MLQVHYVYLGSDELWIGVFCLEDLHLASFLLEGKTH